MFTKHIKSTQVPVLKVLHGLGQGYASLITESVSLYFLEEYIQD